MPFMTTDASYAHRFDPPRKRSAQARRACIQPQRNSAAARFDCRYDCGPLRVITQNLAHAVAVGADVAMVSPVFADPAHANRQTLGWDGFRALVADVPLPIYAHGGVTAAMLLEARRAGAIGVAASETALLVRAAS